MRLLVSLLLLLFLLPSPEALADEGFLYRFDELRGECDQPGYGTYPMRLTITRRNGDQIEGTIHWPTLRDSRTAFRGTLREGHVEVEEHTLLQGSGIGLPTNYAGDVHGGRLEGTWSGSGYSGTFYLSPYGRPAREPVGGVAEDLEPAAAATPVVESGSGSTSDPLYCYDELRGECDQPGYGTYPMRLTIARRDGGQVEGVLHWPTLRDSKTEFRGTLHEGHLEVVEHTLLQGGGILLPTTYVGDLQDGRVEGTWNGSGYSGTFYLSPFGSPAREPASRVTENSEPGPLAPEGHDAMEGSGAGEEVEPAPLDLERLDPETGGGAEEAAPAPLAPEGHDPVEGSGVAEGVAPTPLALEEPPLSAPVEGSRVVEEAELAEPRGLAPEERESAPMTHEIHPSTPLGGPHRPAAGVVPPRQDEPGRGKSPRQNGGTATAPVPGPAGGGWPIVILGLVSLPVTLLGAHVLVRTQTQAARRLVAWGFGIWIKGSLVIVVVLGLSIFTDNSRPLVVVSDAAFVNWGLSLFVALTPFGGLAGYLTLVLLWLTFAVMSLFLGEGLRESSRSTLLGTPEFVTDRIEREHEPEAEPKPEARGVKTYDERGRYTGWTSPDGKTYDERGAYKGWTSPDGKSYDERGAYKGWTSPEGKAYDDRGAYKGWTSPEGKAYDERGTFRGTDVPE